MTNQTVPSVEVPLPLRRVAARFISEGRMATLDNPTAGLRQLALDGDGESRPSRHLRSLDLGEGAQ